jgi:DNA-binding protein HU-beta
MNKADLVARIAKEAALTKRQSEKMLEALMGSIQDALSKGEKITLVGFGTFSAMARSARTGRNPRTGQALYLVVYVYRAGNSDCLERGYDQPIEHLGGGADDAIRPCICSCRERCPHSAGCSVSPALPRWQGHTLSRQIAQSQT